LNTMKHKTDHINRKDPNKSQRGSVVVMAIFLAFFIAILMITLEFLQLSDLEITTNQIKEMEAYYCAEAGVEMFIFLWKSGFVGIPDNAYFSANFGPFTCAFSGAASTRTTQFRAYNSRVDPNIPYYHRIHIDSTGNTEGFSRKVYAHYRRVWLYPGQPDERYFQVQRWREL